MKRRDFLTTSSLLAGTALFTGATLGKRGGPRRPHLDERMH